MGEDAVCVDSLLKFAFSFHIVGPGYQTQAVRGTFLPTYYLVGLGTKVLIN